MARRANDGATLVEEADRRFVESLPPGTERDTVVASLVRYRAAGTRAARGARPLGTLRRGQDLETGPVSDRVRGRPLLLVFGSFT
jgi:hypothetical protein